MAIDVQRLDIREQNRAVEQVLEATENPRHRYLLEAYLRHRYLESAGRYEEILEPELTVDHPVYRFSLFGRPSFKLEGRDQVATLYATGPRRISASSTWRTRSSLSATT